MEAFIDEMVIALSKAFQSEEYTEKRSEVVGEVQGRQSEITEKIFLKST